MKVITNVTLRVKAGEEFTPPESAIDLHEKTAAGLLKKGHVRRPSVPPEPEAGKTAGAGGGAS
jgi:hypothetical protein